MHVEMEPSANVVLAEDDPEDRFMILRALRRARPALRVTEVRDGIELIDYLASRDEGGLPNLILLDLNMPRMNGREALVAIRGNARLAALSVVVLSTSIEPEDMHCVQALGVSKFLSKPEAFRSLVRILDVLLLEHFGPAQDLETECVPR